MSRETVKKAFTQVLPEMGFPVIRDVQINYAMMVQDKLDMASADVDSDTDAYADAIADADPEHNLGKRPVFGAIEAGTGTGKTLGYLIPVLLHIAETGGHARITTHTLALQDQIYGREAIFADRQPDFSRGDRSDMAIALEVVRRMTGKTLQSGFRKGRQAYISPSAVLELFDAEKEVKFQRTGEDAEIAADLQKWALDVQSLQTRQEALFPPKKKSGDHGDADALLDEQAKKKLEKARAQLARDLENDPMQGLIVSFLDAHDGHLPMGVSASEIGMVHGIDDNPFHRRHAGNSGNRDVLVVSHSLSLFNLYHGGNFLPPAKVIVHDEADTMAGVAEMYARKKLRPDLLQNILRRAFPVNDKQRPSVVQHLDDLLTVVRDWFTEEYNKRNPVDEDGEPIRENPVLEIMLDDKQPITTAALGYLLNLEDAIKAVASMDVPDNAVAAHQRCHAVMKQVHEDLREAKEAFPANTEFGTRQLRLSLDANGLPDGKKPENGYKALGLTWTPIRKFPAFEVVNLYASRMFGREWLFKSRHLQAVLLTSATLRTPASTNGQISEWSYMERLLGMPENSGQQVQVKHFGDISRIHLVRKGTLPVPFVSDKKDKDGKPVYQPDWVACAQAVLVDMLKTGEPALVLASSFRDVQTVKEGFINDRIWWQTNSTEMHWQDGVDALLRGDKQIIVTPSIWAGANIRDAQGGQMIRHLGFFRVPIPGNDAVREKALANYFRWKGLRNGADPDLTATHVIRNLANCAGKHKMTQGLGRGIRAASDKIEVWLMDPRFNDPQWKATFPERFRGLFADTDVLHLMDMRSAWMSPEELKAALAAEQVKKSDRLHWLKQPLSSKSSDDLKEP